MENQQNYTKPRKENG